jgi:membrane protease YdiL (CAAX protease family)
MSRTDVFRQIPWSVTHCCIALGVIIIARAVFHVLGLMDWSFRLFLFGLALWLLMFAWMAIYPLWIARTKGMLRRPSAGRVLKELGLGIPLALCLIVAESFFLVLLQKLNDEPIEANPVWSAISSAPNDPRLYLILVPMFTLGPIAEELFFRGLLYNALRRSIAPVIAVVLQALVFALVHYNWPYTNIAYLAIVFASGIILAGVYEWRKTIWSPIAIHALKNLAFAAPVIGLMILNSHTPARTWFEAEWPPEWLEASRDVIERQASGEAQRLYAINTWGSKGLRMWKREARGFQAVCDWFGEDREACAKARVGIATIYQYYLMDFRRAVVESDRILSEFTDQPEACVQALMIKGWAYHQLGDFQRSGEAFEEVIDSYASIEWAQEDALEALRSLYGR